MDADVVIVGAGLAGLRCAHALVHRGYQVRVIESEDAPGGRVRTEMIDGYRCDRGFQLLNPAYPAVRAHVDIDSLDLRRAGRGVVTVDGAGVERTIADPMAHPRCARATARTLRELGVTSPGGVVATMRWGAPALLPIQRLLRLPDSQLADDWNRLSIPPRLRTEVLQPFLSGVLADSGGSTSDRYVRLVLRSFIRGTPGVPARGMHMLPDQLARDCGAQIDYNATVTSIDDRNGAQVHTADGDTVTARAIVVATAAPMASRLVSMEMSSMLGLSTWWFAADNASNSTFLRVSGSGGPICNTANMSAIAPDYAPEGMSLIQASTLLDTSGPADEGLIRSELARLWATSTKSWKVVTRNDIPHALPAYPAGPPLRSAQRVGQSIVVAGDHRDTPSIQGALVSGGRAANSVDRILQGN